MFPSLLRAFHLVPFLVPLFAATSAAAADEAADHYAKERAMCFAGKAGQDREACLRDAAAARDAARREAPAAAAGADPARLERNALERCRALPESYRRDCESRVRGGGESSGSVEGGGVLKQSVTTEIGRPPSSRP